MKLFELFDTKFDGDVEIHEDSPYDFWASTIIDGKHVNFNMNQRDDSAPWTVEFDVNGSMKKTKTGSEIKIFAFVTEMFKKVVARRDPYRIKFGAKSDEPSRVSLYKKLAKKIQGYKLKPLENRDSDYVTFELVRDY